MRLAIISENDDVYVEFSPKEVRELLKKEFEITKSIDRAFDRVVETLKKKTIKMG